MQCVEVTRRTAIGCGQLLKMPAEPTPNGGALGSERPRGMLRGEEWPRDPLLAGSIGKVAMLMT